jgi:hypothetical protein
VTDVTVQQGDLQSERTKCYSDCDLVAVLWAVVLQQRQQRRSDGTLPQGIEAGLKTTVKAAESVPIRRVSLPHHIAWQFVILDEQLGSDLLPVNYLPFTGMCLITFSGKRKDVTLDECFGDLSTKKSTARHPREPLYRYAV